MMSRAPARARGHRRQGVALISVLYFLVLCGLTTSALFFAERSHARGSSEATQGARVLASAEGALYAALVNWNSSTRVRQQVGSTMTIAAPAISDLEGSTYVTRLTSELFSIVVDVRAPSNDPSRRVGLLVRLPTPNRLRAALVSAVDVTIGPDVRILIDSATCGDSATAAVVMTPSANLTIDPAIPPNEQPQMMRDAAAADSATYLRFGATWWNDLGSAADIRLASGARVTPSPEVIAGSCTTSATNWGDPSSIESTCANRSPLIVADGDLTIAGGVGQGALLVSGHLTIAGPFTFSGQIVARGGIETLADNIAISGAMYAWRTGDDSTAVHASSSNVMLTHRTTLRYSGCDAWHGIASWHKPHRVRNRAWAELF
ncbi:MAG: hypothetical protein ACJ796_07415 [Gemmatimonadaceae bacterium]